MLRFQAGDRQAFEELFDRHQQRVLNTVYRFLGDRHRAEDIAQDVFLRIYKAAGSYRPSAQFTTWVYTITRNLCFNEMRRRSRQAVSLSRAARSSDDGSPGLPDPGAEPPARGVAREELRQRVQQALAQLTPDQRMAVVLYRFQELSYEQVAAVMGSTVEAVKSLLHRARHRLRDQLARYVRHEK